MTRIATALRKEGAHKIQLQKRKEKEEKKYSVFCFVCGDEFDTNSTKAKFCSAKCRGKYERENYPRKNVESKCARCGKLFEARKGSATKFCSQSCGVLTDLQNRPRKRGAGGRYITPA